jgi:hypothetical protein
MKENSEKLHDDYVNRLRTHFKVKDGSLDFLKDTAKVISYMETTPVRGGKLPSVNTLKTYFIHIVSVLRDKGGDDMKTTLETYREKMTTYRDKYDEISEKQEPTPAEVQKWSDWEDIIKVRDALALKADSFRTFQNYLTVCLYTYIEPQRLDFSPMYFVNEMPEDPTKNVCLMSDTSATFIFREYKSQATYGERKIQIPPELFAILQKWRSYNKSQWLITKLDKTTALSDAMLGQKIQSIFEAETGKKTSVDILRHAYITHKRANEMKLLDKEKMAKAMGHSVATNEKYRRFLK